MNKVMYTDSPRLTAYGNMSDEVESTQESKPSKLGRPLKLAKELTFLSEAERTFVLEYVRTKNASEAYRRACPDRENKDTERKMAAEWLKKPLIRRAIKRGMARAASRLQMRASTVLTHVGAIAISNIADYYEEGPDGLPKLKRWRKLSFFQKMAISEIVEKFDRDGNKQVSYKFHSKIEALKMFSQRFGLLGDSPALQEIAALLREATSASLARAAAQSLPGRTPGILEAGGTVSEPEQQDDRTAVE